MRYFRSVSGVVEICSGIPGPVSVEVLGKTDDRQPGPLVVVALVSLVVVVRSALDSLVAVVGMPRGLPLNCCLEV